MVRIRFPPPVNPSPQRIRARGRKVVSEVVAGADLTTDDRPDAVRRQRTAVTAHRGLAPRWGGPIQTPGSYERLDVAMIEGGDRRRDARPRRYERCLSLPRHW